MRREKRKTEQRLQERSIIEQDLKNECSKLASALAACQVAHEAAMQRAQEAAAAHEKDAVEAARAAAYSEGSSAAQQSSLQELQQSKVLRCRRLALLGGRLPVPRSGYPLSTRCRAPISFTSRPYYLARLYCFPCECRACWSDWGTVYDSIVDRSRALVPLSWCMWRIMCDMRHSYA